MIPPNYAPHRLRDLFVLLLRVLTAPKRDLTTVKDNDTPPFDVPVTRAAHELRQGDRIETLAGIRTVERVMSLDQGRMAVVVVDPANPGFSAVLRFPLDAPVKVVLQ